MLQNDTKKLAEAKQLVYLKGFTDGVLIVGEYAGKKVGRVWWGRQSSTGDVQNMLLVVSVVRRVNSYSQRPQHITMGAYHLSSHCASLSPNWAGQRGEDCDQERDDCRGRRHPVLGCASLAIMHVQLHLAGMAVPPSRVVSAGAWQPACPQLH